MSVELIDKIKPKNNGSFALVDAEDVEMPDGTRLSEYTPETSIPKNPVFDLGAMGLSAVTLPIGNATVEADTTEIVTALDAGKVKFAIPFSMDGTVATGTLTMQGFTDGSGFYQCTAMLMMDAVLFAVVIIDAGSITVAVAPVAETVGIPTVTAADNGKVMSVVNGAWAAAAMEISGGLPEVTANDDGKFLRVVNGAWTATTVDNAEEASF